MVDDLVNQFVGGVDLRIERDKFVFGFQEMSADFFFVGFFDSDFVGVQMSEQPGSF